MYSTVLIWHIHHLWYTIWFVAMVICPLTGFLSCLTAADAISDDLCRGQFRHPQCTGEDCPYQAEWVVAGDQVRFRVTARVGDANWVAIGFSDNTMMVGDMLFYTLTTACILVLTLLKVVDILLILT